MTNPPGPSGPTGPSGQGGPYGPPPQRPGGPPPGWEAPRRGAPPPREKGVIGSLLDANFNHLVTPKIIKLWYVIALLLISFQCLVILGFGLWVASWDDFWAWGVIMVVATPLVWLFEVLLVRIVMEAVVVRFKGVEHLRVIRDKI